MEYNDFSRLGDGLGRVRKARACLYLIEQEALRQVDRRGRIEALSTLPPESAAIVAALVDDDESMRRDLPGEADDAFLESFRNARRAAPPANFAALAATVGKWRVLIPERTLLRAEVLHQMALRHRMPINRSKEIARAFGVGSSEFDHAYRTVSGNDVDTAFVAASGPFAALRRLVTRRD